MKKILVGTLLTIALLGITGCADTNSVVKPTGYETVPASAKKDDIKITNVYYSLEDGSTTSSLDGVAQAFATTIELSNGKKYNCGEIDLITEKGLKKGNIVKSIKTNGIDLTDIEVE